MFFKTTITTFFLLFFSITVYTQTPPYFHYSSSDGLASSTVFHMLQDKDGYFWFGTLNGVSKFDGTRFTNFKKEDGLNSNSITQIIEADNQTLYLSNFERGINLMKNGKIENYSDNFKGDYFSIAYMITYQEKLYAYTPLLNFHTFSLKPSQKQQISIIKTNPILVNKLIMLPDNTLGAITHTGLYDLSNTTFKKIDLKNIEETNYRAYAKFADGSYLLSAKNFIYKLKGKSVLKKYTINLSDTDFIENIFIDRYHNIWFSVSGKGFYVIYNQTQKIVNIGEKLQLSTTHVTHFFEDKEGNIWVSTYGKGVYCLHNLYLKNYTEFDGLNNNNINKIAKDTKGRLILGTYKGINILENSTIHKLKGGVNDDYIGDVNSILVDKNKVFVAWSKALQNQKLLKYKELVFNFTTKRSLLKTSSGNFVYGGWGNEIRISKTFEKISKTPTNFIFFNAPKSNRMYDLKEDSQKNIWIASALGLAKISNFRQKDSIWSFDKMFFKNDKIVNSRINNIHQDNNNTIWIAGSNGVATYNLSSNQLKSYKNINGFDVTSANAIASDGKNRIWIGTLNGLFVFDGKTTKYFNSKTGLLTNEILSLLYDKELDYLYIGTSNGLSIMDLKLFDNYSYTDLNVKINAIKSGNQIINPHQSLKFKPTQNNLYFDFSVLFFSSPETINYKYKLNNQLLENQTHFLNLVSLQKGAYKLEISAKTYNTNWSKPLTIHFEILPFFYETTWFYLIVITAIILLIIYIVKNRIKKSKQKNKQQLALNERINELKHQALASMMNPHFIFNSLNSVQYLVNSKRNEEANNYIAIMAKLIRKNLDMAQNRFILLDEEINRLKLYLELEKLRLQNGFKYEFIISNEIDIHHTMIPNMIIQPFVENTLWHGIVKSGNKGLVSISFSFENIEIDEKIYKSLIIKITDNGIGIIESKKHKNQDHVSKGIDIIIERLRLLSEKMELPQPIMIDDLTNKNKNLHGTEVVISLPLPLYKIII